MTQVALLEAEAELEGAGLQCSFSQRDQAGRLLFSAQADQVQPDKILQELKRCVGLAGWLSGSHYITSLTNCS